MAPQRLKHMRWPLLRRRSRVRASRQKLQALLISKPAARAWKLSENFFPFLDL
jgi:hypothetical protein